MKSYTHTLRYLYGLQHRGMKFGLHNTRTILKSLGNPERQFPSIHIAGTNGKGSTASFLASLAMESGLKTALYTSPHLLRFTERIRINGIEIPEKRLIEYVERMHEIIESVHATFFEATTCVAFQYFADQNVDLAIVETGLGGRLDATNVIKPLISVITNVSIDHEEYLGHTLSTIAREKAGIIKPGIPCVTSSTDRVVVQTLRAIARKKRSPFFEAKRVTAANVNERGINNTEVSLSTTRLRNITARLGINGLHQTSNARLAVSCLHVLHRNPVAPRPLKRISRAAIIRGLERVSENTGLRGRLETIKGKKRLILDVAHNLDAIRKLVSALESRYRYKLVVVFGVMKDKEYSRMLGELSRLAMVVVAVAPATSRALKGRLLCEELERQGIPFVSGGAVSKGIQIARKLAGRRRNVLVTGSHYVVGEALESVSTKKLDNRR